MNDLNKYLRTLSEYPLKQYPRAAQFIVNQAAFESRMEAVRIVKKKYILRNTFVTRRIQFQQSGFSRNLADIQSSFGALPSVDFMAKQETGFVIRPSKGRAVAVPTRGARISRSIQKRKRRVYRAGSLGNVRRASQYKGKTKRARIVAMLQTMARKKDKTPALVPFSNKPGIYVIRNVRKNTNSMFNFRMVKLYDLSRKQVKIKPRPWMRPTVDNKIIPKFPKIAQTAWQRFFDRL